MKNKKNSNTQNDEINNSMDESDDDTPSSCETRRKIEDLLENRRYKDELGDFSDIFDIPEIETV